jgi:peptidoglycan/LPS O-acetylase OafA/YrhL
MSRMTRPSPPLAATGARARARRQDVPALTGLRFVAAFSVLLAHGLGVIEPTNDPNHPVIYWLKTAAGFGMTLFFVLSGFVIHYNYAALVTEERLRGIGAFFWARFARLYPLFLLMLLIYVLVSQKHIAFWTGHPERFHDIIEALPYFLLAIQSWVYKVIDGDVLINAVRGGSPPTWSISTEWFFYFAYPCIAWLILRARSMAVTLLVAVAWCGIWSAVAAGVYDETPQLNAWAVAQFGPIAGIDDQQNSFIRWLLYISPYLRIGEFVLGVITAHVYVTLQNRKVGGAENILGTAVFLAAATSVLLLIYVEYSPNVPVTIVRKLNQNFALAPSVALLIFCAARYDNIASRLLTSRPAVALGEASYSIYLVHSIVFIAAVKLDGSPAHGIWYNATKLALLMAAVIAISLLLYSYYEAPARRWLRERLGRRAPDAASARLSSRWRTRFP